MEPSPSAVLVGVASYPRNLHPQHLRVTGGTPLRGTVGISAAKNAALPILCASLMLSRGARIANLPNLSDVHAMVPLLAQAGADLTLEAPKPDNVASRVGHVAPRPTLRGNHVTFHSFPAQHMRASVLMLGATMALGDRVVLPLPGGDPIGKRPIDLHLEGLSRMGATVSLRGGMIHAQAPQRLRGIRMAFPVVSVGATENLLMAACLARGTTVLDNAAQEPEIDDLIAFLNTAGAKVFRTLPQRLVVEGVEGLEYGAHDVIADRVEAFSFAAAAAATNGSIRMSDLRPDLLGHGALEAMERVGIRWEEFSEPDGTSGIKVERASEGLRPCQLQTGVYPGFATDMQAQIMALMCLADGQSRITETIFERRMSHAEQLRTMGADISVRRNTAFVRGPAAFAPTTVTAGDIRASFSLVIAALCAEGTSVIRGAEHLTRGYAALPEKIAALGGQAVFGPPRTTSEPHVEQR